MNEDVAGSSGFVRRGEGGDGFAMGDGTPVRFWAVTTYVQRGHPMEELEHHARFLAKRGVNMVRYHGHLEPKLEDDPDAPLDDADDESLDQAWRLVAAMKREGIYTTISPYWAKTLEEVPARWGIGGWPGDRPPFGLLFFNETMQRAYKSWLRQLLAVPNPYTGIPLAEDPALAIIQLQNEDSMLFWTMQNVQGRQREELGERFGEWLAAEYGSIDRARAAWGNVEIEGDDPDRGIVGIAQVWEWTQERQGGRKRRLDDQLRFFAETMAAFNAEVARFLREDLGCRQLINAGNWRTADAIRLGDVERWTYTANDVIAVNGYYSPVHLGPDRGWRINPGDRFEDASALRDPRSLPTNIKQVAGFPTILTETRWVPPSSYQSESPFLAAAYSSLCGIDGFYWFSTSEPEWSVEDRAEWDAASRKKWEVAQPMVLGQFPAAALAYRRGDIAEAEPIVSEHRPLGHLWERRPPLIAEDPRYDPNRDLGDAARRPGDGGAVDPLAFLVGPVEVAFGSDPSRTRVGPLRRFIDRDRGIIRGATGQVALNSRLGRAAVDAPRVQGIGGFWPEGEAIRLSDVELRSGNPYATVLVVALDDEPIATSRRVLVQVGTRARPTDWAVEPERFEIDDGDSTVDGYRIVETGRMPWAVESTKMTLRVANPGLRRAITLDANGEAIASRPIEAAGEGRVGLDLPRDAFYVMLTGD